LVTIFWLLYNANYPSFPQLDLLDVHTFNNRFIVYEKNYILYCTECLRTMNIPLKD